MSLNYPYVIISKLTDEIIRAAIESFVNLNDEILYRKKQEEIELEVEVDAELKTELDIKA